MDIKKQIALTIAIPDFLDEQRKSGGVEVVEIVYKILDFYYRGIENHFLTDGQIVRICRRIDRLGQDLELVCNPQLYLTSWLWIGDTVTKWIDISLSVENYEAATNLRRLLNSEYV